MNKGFVNVALATSTYKQPVQFATEAQEGLQQGELLKLSGPAIFLDRVSGNGRKYIPDSVHQQVAMLQPRIQKKALFGELDHPMTDDINRLAYVQMQNVSHRIDAIWFNADEQTYYITVTVLDTPNGRILKAIHDAGSPLYVSLRSLLDPSKGRQNNGYVDAYMMALITIDFVSRPGFADAELKAVDTVSNESMLAVCESLDIFHSNKYSNMSKKSNRSQHRYIPVISMESFAGVATEPTKEFSAAVTDFLADVLKKFPGDFTVDEFAKAYPDSMFNGMIIGLYEDTNELMIKDANSSTVAIIELDSDSDGVFNVADDADINYYSTEVEQHSDSVQQGTEMYAVIATEGYEPSDDFMQTATDIAEYLRDNYADGFTTDEFTDKIAGEIAEKFDVTARIDDDEIKIEGENDGASISASDSGDDLHVPGSVTEYWQPGTESYEVGQNVQLIDASGDAIASGEIEATGTYGDCKDTIEKEDEHGANLMSDANISDDAEVIKIAGNWYYIEDGMSVEPLEPEAGTESLAIGDNVKVTCDGEETTGTIKDIQSLGDIRDELDEDDATCYEGCADDMTMYKIDDKWYAESDDCMIQPVTDVAEESLSPVTLCKPVCVNGSVIPANETLMFNADGLARFNGKQVSIYDFPTSVIAKESLDGVTEQTEGNEPEPVKNDFNKKSNLDAGDDVQAEIVDDEDDDAKDNKASATQQMYNIVEDDVATIVEDEDDTPANDDKKPSQKHDDDDKDDDPDKEPDNLEADNELAEEAQRIFNMPNSKFSDNYAVEHMPAAYKNIWGGLSDKAKAVIAKQAMNAKIATEAQNLQFWSSTNFIAVEKACLLSKGKVEAAMESLKPIDVRTKFLLGD
jgi:hypothetical protein